MAFAKRRAGKRAASEGTEGGQVIRERRNDLFFLLALALCALCLLTCSGCVAPAALRAGPVKVSLAPVADSTGRQRATITAQKKDLDAAGVSIRKAIAIADGPGITPDDQVTLRLELKAAERAESAAVTKNATLAMENEKLSKQVPLLQGEIKKAADDYKAKAIAAWHEREAEVWKTRIFGFPVAFMIGALAGAIATFIFRAVLSAAWLSVRAYLHL